MTTHLDSPSLAPTLAKLGASCIGIVLSGFALGIAGFYAVNPSPPWGDEDAFRSDAFQFSTDLLMSGFVAPEATGDNFFLLAAAWTLPIVSLRLLAFAAWLFGRNLVHRLVIVRRGGHIVVAGAPASVALVLGWKEHTVWVRPTALSLAERAGLRPDCAVVIGTLDSARIHQQAGIECARQTLLLDNNGTANVQQAFDLLDALSSGGIHAWPCDLHVAVQSRRLADEFEHRLAHTVVPRGAEIHVFQTQALGVRRLFLDNPLQKFVFACCDDLIRVVLIGYGSWGEEVLRALLLESHPVEPHRIEIVVVERNATYLEQVWNENCPDRALLPQVTWQALDVLNDAAFSRWLDNMVASDPPPSAYFVCLGPSELSYVTALRLETGLKQRLADATAIYFCDNGPMTQQKLAGRHRALAMLHAFGTLDASLDEELVLHVERDALARRIHERYLDTCLARGGNIGDQPSWQHWEALPYTFRRENRSQADHHLYKLQQIGCRLRKRTTGQVFCFSASEIESLAIAEHSRWVTSRILAGWRYGAARDDTLKIHPHIVPYKHLTEAIKELDRDVIRNLPVLFGELGLEIVRDMVFFIDAGIHASWPDPRAVCTAALNAAARDFPDRFPLLMIRIESSVDQVLGQAWLEAGGELWIATGEPLHLLVSHVDDATGMLIDTLLHDAARIIATQPSPAYAFPQGIATHLMRSDGNVTTYVSLGTRHDYR